MRMMSKEDFLKRSSNTLKGLYDMLQKLPVIGLDELHKEKTVLVIIDMVNGFAREGALKSPRIEAIISEIAKLSVACDKLQIRKLAFADCHTDLSPEFDAYPQHCIKDTLEAEMVDELKKIGGYTLVPKNSTNGFLEEEFQNWLTKNRHIDTFIIAGDCTDICIQQYATTLKSWFNMQNKKSRIIVPANMVETYDFGLHDAELVNVMALYNMMTNGVEIVKEIKQL
ncbi:MAG: cysteine hydrolase family protein [Bacillota bacterium]